MDLERLALQRAAEQLEARAWEERDPAPPRVYDYVGRCRKCGTAPLTAKNRSGLCRDCWQTTNHRHRHRYKPPEVP